jgi:uncharacterized protein YggE
MLDALEKTGVQENEMHTSYFSISLTCNHSQFSNAQKLIGYTVTNSITIKSSPCQMCLAGLTRQSAQGQKQDLSGLFFTISEEKMESKLRANLTVQTQ